MNREEAIETIKKALPLSDTLAEAFYTLHPELRESEDERMCTRCIDLLRKVSAYSGEEYLGVEIADCIIWLQALIKKLKESLHITEICKEDADSFTDEDERIREWIIKLIKEVEYDEDWCVKSVDCNKAVAYLEKQKEQKPEERFEEAREKYQVEWSEEDEKRIKQLIYDTEAIRAGYEKKKEQLGDRFNDALIKDCDEQIRWLKSLRPQPHWKPSEEQMNLLLNIEGKLRADGKLVKATQLAELYEQLKKLM